MTRAQAKRAGGGTAGRSSALTTAGTAPNNLPSEKVLKAWKEMLVFLQEFVENNFGKAALRRVVREPTYYEKLTNSGEWRSVAWVPVVVAVWAVCWVRSEVLVVEAVDIS